MQKCSKCSRNKMSSRCYYCDPVGRVKDPTPEQIEARAAIIRSGWTEAERNKKAGIAKEPPVEIQVVNLSAFR